MKSAAVAIVTGSGKRRVGAFVADALAARGYHLVIHYLNSAADAEAAVSTHRQKGVRAIAIKANVADEESIRQLVQATLENFGRIDVLVNCAAIWQSKPLEEVRAADIQAHFEVNTLGTFLCSQQVGLTMVRQKQGGCIVTIGDWAVIRPYLNYSAYFLSKGAIPTLTRSLAVELGTRNPRVRVNCILPGPVFLPSGLSIEEREQSVKSTLVQREGRPENIAQAVLYLIDNDFVTGDCITVDGGRSTFAGGI